VVVVDRRWVQLHGGTTAASTSSPAAVVDRHRDLEARHCGTAAASTSSPAAVVDWHRQHGTRRAVRHAAARCADTRHVVQRGVCGTPRRRWRGR
jgi:hypothetical protein